MSAFLGDPSRRFPLLFACSGGSSTAHGLLGEPLELGGELSPSGVKQSSRSQCVCVCVHARTLTLSERRGSLSQDSEKASASQIAIGSLGRGCYGVSILAGKFVSLFETALQARKMGTDSLQTVLLPEQPQGLPTITTRSSILAREECVALPGMLAAPHSLAPK